jgi:hypothetical protein
VLKQRRPQSSKNRGRQQRAVRQVPASAAATRTVRLRLPARQITQSLCAAVDRKRRRTFASRLGVAAPKHQKALDGCAKPGKNLLRFPDWFSSSPQFLDMPLLFGNAEFGFGDQPVELLA